MCLRKYKFNAFQEIHIFGLFYWWQLICELANTAWHTCNFSISVHAHIDTLMLKWRWTNHAAELCIYMYCCQGHEHALDAAWTWALVYKLFSSNKRHQSYYDFPVRNLDIFNLQLFLFVCHKNFEPKKSWFFFLIFSKIQHWWILLPEIAFVADFLSKNVYFNIMSL